MKTALDVRTSSEAMRAVLVQAQQLSALEKTAAAPAQRERPLPITESGRLEQARRDLELAVAAYNQLRAHDAPALTVEAAMAAAVDRSLDALVAGGTGRAMFDRQTQVLLRELAENPYLHTRELLGDLTQIVRTRAAEEGLDRVRPEDAIRILQAAADPKNNPRVHQGAYSLASDGKRGHMESAIAIARMGGDSTRWLEGFAQNHIKDLRNALAAPSLLLSSLRQAGLDDRATYLLWSGALEKELGRIGGLELGARPAALEALKEDLEMLLPKSAMEGLVRRAGVDPAAFAELERTVKAAASETVTLSAPRHLSPGLAAVEMPAIDRAHLFKWSGDINYHINLRNLAYGWPNLGDAIRLRAYHASTNREPLAILEMTHGLPRMALDFTSPEGRVRNEGDHLLCGTINGERAPLVKWDRPAVSSVAITPQDMIAEYARGDRTPAKFAEWFDTDMAYALANQRSASPRELQDGYARLRREGALDVREGEFAGALRELARSGKKIDIAVFHELAWTKNRVEVLEALQGALKPGGRAFVPLTWWSPRGMEGDGVREHLPFADKVQTGPGREISLAKYLAEKFPEHFEVDAGESCLVVKGTRQPVRLPEMDAQPTGETVRHGFPVLRWTVNAPASSGFGALFRGR